MTRSIAFCFPYREGGGVPVLFARLASHLQSEGRTAYVIDYPDGSMAKQIAGTGVGLIPYKDDAPVPVPPGTALVYQTTRTWSLFPSLAIPDETKLFFWNLHPFNLVPTFPGLRNLMMSREAFGRILLKTALRRYRSEMIRFIRFCEETQALVFMDDANVGNSERYLDIRLKDPRYLPISGGNLAESRAPRAAGGGDLHFAWIGRIADFKHHILFRALSDIDAAQGAIGRRIRFSVIGSGPFLEDLRAKAAALKHIEVVFLGEKNLESLRDFLLDDVDILFAMGASALEGPRIGVPTILLDVAYAAVGEGYVYQWLHERPGFTLGEVVSAAHFRPGNDSLISRIRTYQNAPDTLSRAAHAHYSRHHSIEGVSERLLELVNQSQCTYDRFRAQRFLTKDPFFELFAAVRKRMAPR